LVGCYGFRPCIAPLLFINEGKRFLRVTPRLPRSNGARRGSPTEHARNNPEHDRENSERDDSALPTLEACLSRRQHEIFFSHFVPKSAVVYRL
jgi:hypothetical protein